MAFEPSCSVGKTLNDPCHLLKYCKVQGCKSISQYSEEELEILKLRSKVSDISSVCYHHDVVYFGRYQTTFSKYCCDPFNKHSRQVKSSLRVITLKTAREYNLVPGQKLCTDCRKRLFTKDENTEDDREDVSNNDPLYFDRQSQADELNLSLTGLGCSPLKSVSSRDRNSYGKRKIIEVKEASEQKISSVLGIDTEMSCCSSRRDIDSLMEMVKEKFKLATSNAEKVKLLTLVPESWTIEKTQNYFGTSKRSVAQARDLRKSKGVLPEPERRLGRKLSEVVKKQIENFYCSDEFSRMCPGKKEYVSVRINGERQHIQKRLLLVNLKELHIEYLKVHGSEVGFSKFCELRPKWCIPVGSASGLHSVCVCQYHQNFKLLVSQIPSVADYKEILEKIVCGLGNRDCMLRNCDHCPGIDNLKTELFQEFDSHGIENVDVSQWSKDDFKCEIKRSTLSVEQFVDEVSLQSDKLREHHFIAKSQSSYLEHAKSNLKEDEVLILLDFAENYSFLIQDAVQGFHWNNSQATLHPFVTYHSADGNIVSKSFCVISDNMNHETNTVHAFLRVLLKDLTTQFPRLKTCIYFSDGAGSQYKNYKNIANLCNHEVDFGLNSEWHFFATSHGKSPCDGVGGTVKRLVARASLQSLAQPIDTPKKMFEWCLNHITGIKFFFVSKEEVLEHVQIFGLEERYTQWSTVSGSRIHHCFIPVSCKEVMMKRVSFDQSSTTFTANRVMLKKNVSDYLPGKYVACVYDNEWYLGVVMKSSSEHQDFQVKFLKQSLTNTFTWPKREDICWIPLVHMLCPITTLVVQSAGARCYRLSDAELKEIHRLFDLYRKQQL